MGVPNGSSSNGHVSSRAAKHNLPSHFIGGNHLDAAPPSSVKDFVANHEGHSVISSVSGSPRLSRKWPCVCNSSKVADVVGLVE